MPDPVTTGQPAVRHDVDVWFDAVCPWTWMTSRWVLEVARHRELDVRWHVRCLAILNEGRDLPAEERHHLQDSWALARVVAAAARDHGDAVVGPLYTAIGERRHRGGRTDTAAVVDEALAEVGLPAGLAAAGATDAVDDLVRASHQAASDLVGDDVGSPVVAVDGVGFFGPVVSPAPTGREALDLFDGLLLLTRVDGFFELKRSRTGGPRV